MTPGWCSCAPGSCCGGTGPILTLIYLLGAAAHNGLLWFCVWLSEDHSTSAALVLPLVPMATLTALILALRELTPSLANIRPPAMSRLTLLASTLIPFLTVYVSQQYLREDTRAFLNAATSDELLERSGGLGPSTFNVDRTNIASGAALVGIVAGALLVRWLLDRLDLPEKAVGWGLFAAYVEVLWVWILAKRLSNFTGEVEAWVRTRRLSQWLLDRWGDLIDALGPVGQPVEAVGQWFWGAIGQADAIIVVPIAWLTVGAVVYGRKLEARQRAAVSGSRGAPRDAVGSGACAASRRRCAESGTRPPRTSAGGSPRWATGSGCSPWRVWRRCCSSAWSSCSADRSRSGSPRLLRWIVGAEGLPGRADPVALPVGDQQGGLHRRPRRRCSARRSTGSSDTSTRTDTEPRTRRRATG